MESLLTIAGPVLALAGAAIGLWGTLLMCRAYHPFTTWKMIRHLGAVLALYATGRGDAARDEMKLASEIGQLNEENRYRTLEGVYVLVFSFLVQSAGAMLVLADVAIHRK